MRNNRQIPALGLWWSIGGIFIRNQTAFCRGLWWAWANNCWSYMSSQERRITGSAELLSLGKQWKINPHLPGKEYGDQQAKVRTLFLVRWFHVGEFYNWKKIMNFWILKRQLGYRFSVKKRNEECADYPWGVHSVWVWTGPILIFLIIFRYSKCETEVLESAWGIFTCIYMQSACGNHIRNTCSCDWL